MSKPAKLRQKEFANGTPSPVVLGPVAQRWQLRETLANDARWTVKYAKAKLATDGAKRMDIAVPMFRYKNHVGIDRRHGLIRTWTATDAARHDGTQLPDLLDRANTASGV